MALSRGSKWFLALGLLVVAGGLGGLWWLDTNVFVDDVEPGQPVDYEVRRGQSVASVGEELQELGVVRSSWRFRTAAEEQGLSQTLQPGRFELETGMETEAVVEVLAAGPIAPPQIRFTVQEGLTVEQTLERLAEQFDHDVDDFRAVLLERTEAGSNAPGTLQIPEWVPEPGEIEDEDIEPYEGLLFPETYDVADDAAPLDILQRMVEQLNRTLNQIPDEVVQAAIEDEERTLYDHLIIASLIERETRVDAEREMIAGVIDNRLEEAMRLQIDATVVYALGGGPRQIVTFDDLEIDHPHNTYRIDGLPPTPIAGAGAASLRAAFEPADVPYRFYVLDAECDGSHVFAETADEHDTNVQAFRDAGRCQEELDP